MTGNPFDHSRFLGYISEVTPQFVNVHFPSSTLLNRFTHDGEDYSGGLVGSFVVIEGEHHGFLAKIIEIGLSESERLRLTEKAFRSKEFHPTARLEVLLSFSDFNSLEITKGLNCFPCVGAKVFACSAHFLQDYFKRFGLDESDLENAPIFDLAVLASSRTTDVTVSQQALFGRHCVVVGTTGGGKSWTTARLIEETMRVGGKAIILDATGEYSPLSKLKKVRQTTLADDSCFHYSKLTIDDLFLLVRPSGQVQAPKLLDAIKSLKIVECSSCKRQDGLYLKAEQDKQAYERSYNENVEKIDDGLLSFDIMKLSQQLINECVWDNDFNSANKWGKVNDNHKANCVSLLTRINSLTSSSLYKKIFGFDKKPTSKNDLSSLIDAFLKSNDCVLRIAFHEIPYEFQAREVLANAIGRMMLLKARKGAFKQVPLVFFVDEAHQYLNHKIQDEHFVGRPLDAFDQIAKECRKYGLFLCLATQMPRDIPVGTLSQMGTFIVHRLINHYDKEAIANASSVANKNVLSLLPVLGEGEAILMGANFPMPISVRIKKPITPPDSYTPKFKCAV